MSTQHPIRYLTQKEIDREKWDACISNASNQLIYAYSFYLDAMAKQWDGLVLNDYEAVMPLTWNRKYGIYYLYQPFCCAMLGVFGQSLNGIVVKDFLAGIPGKFRFWDISLNPGNLVTNMAFHVHDRKNYILPLNKPYNQLYAGFSDNIKRNIKKAEQSQYAVSKPALQEVLQLARLQMKEFARVSSDDFNRFTKLYHWLEQQQGAVTYGISSTAGKLLSSCVFFTWQNRAYYILAGNHPDGRTTGASHALINAFIKDHAEKNILLDFEGSDIPGLALFYSSFGASEETYPGIKYNRLPVLLRWLKK